MSSGIKETSPPPVSPREENEYAVHEHLASPDGRMCPRHPLLPHPTKSTKEMGSAERLGEAGQTATGLRTLWGTVEVLQTPSRRQPMSCWDTSPVEAPTSLWANPLLHVPHPFLPHGWLPEQAFVAKLWTHAEVCPTLQDWEKTQKLEHFRELS